MMVPLAEMFNHENTQIFYSNDVEDGATAAGSL
jgi:hypothetical protein